MKKIEEIKQRRQNTHIMQRLRTARALEETRDVREVQRDMALIRSPAATALKKQAVVEEIHESDSEMESEDEPMLVEAN